VGRHLNIGAGRIVWQDIVKIDQSQSMGLSFNLPWIPDADDFPTTSLIVP